MNRTTALATAAALSALALCGAGSADADTITAKFTSSLNKSVNVTRFGNTSDVTTVTFNWVRQDSPGLGVNTSIPQNFRTYCVDFDQFVSPNTNVTYNVVDPIAYGFSSSDALALKRLWATYQPIVDTDVESAAFQLAVWEIQDDTVGDLSNSNFKVNAPSDAKTLASQWVANVLNPNYSGGAVELAVITSSTKQDQITVVPTPATASIAGGAGLLALGRRRRRA